MTDAENSSSSAFRSNEPTAEQMLAMALEKQATDPASVQYNDLAGVMSEPVFDATNSSKATTIYGDSGLMAFVENQRQRLRLLAQVEGMMETSRLKISEPINDCYQSYQEIRRLDSRTPDIEALVGATIDATPAMFTKKENRTSADDQALANLAFEAIWEIGEMAVNSYQANNARNGYSTNYGKARRMAWKEFTDRAPSRYSASPVIRNASSGQDALEVYINHSLANTYINDVIQIRNNTGRNLTKCTLLIELEGISADSAEQSLYEYHFHYVDNWPVGESRIVWYPSRSFSGMATNQSVDVIKKVGIVLYSDQLTVLWNSDLSGSSYDNVVKEWADKYLSGDKFTGKWRRKADNWFDPAGHEMVYSGDFTSFNFKELVIEAREGDKVVRIWDSKSPWVKGNKRYICHENFNDIDPEKITLFISFTGSTYEHEIHWER